MATGRASRADRLHERLRGAQRTNVEADESFNLALAIPEIDQAGDTLSSPRRKTPKSSSQERRTPGNVASSGGAGSGSNRTLKSVSVSRRRVKELLPVDGNDTYEMLDTSEESVRPANLEEGLSQSRDQSKSVLVEGTRSSGTKRKRGPSRGELQPVERIAEGLVLPPPRSPIAKPTEFDEIEESPINAPGSGRRRTIRAADETPTSVRLQKLMNVNVEDAALSSSPTANYVRRSNALASARSKRSTTTSRPSHPRSDEPDELENRDWRSSAGDGSATSSEKAEEISALEAAKVIGKKYLKQRPKQTEGRRSPELGSNPVGRPEEQGKNDDEPAEETRLEKRKRGRSRMISPAKQKLPLVKTTKPKRSRPLAKTRDKASPKKARTTGTTATEGVRKAEHAIDITVQHFVNMSQGADTAIPFANRQGDPSVIDVFAQVCGEVVEHTLGQLEVVAEAAQDARDRKGCVIKMRAIEAYWGELSSRLLQHAIHLNHWHSLRKQIKQVQKEKLGLRDEILQLRGEREQVALRMDAIRIKHEQGNKEATYRLDTSALMQDIELAAEQGRYASEPTSRADKQRGELGNLPLALTRVCDEASSLSAQGGVLKQLRDFNALLERAAVALETR